MVTYVRTDSKCGGLVVTKKQERTIKSNQYGLCGTETQSKSGGEQTQQRHPPDAKSHTSLLERPYHAQNVDKYLGPVSAVRP
jgi:hypothetical protein